MTSHARRRNEPTKEGRKTQHWKLLEQWVKEFGWTSGAEIGLQRGWTICHLLQTCPYLRMIGVDFWREPPPEYFEQEQAQSYDHIDIDYWAEVVKQRVAAFGGRGTIYHMRSLDAAEKVKDESLDFVFIDADHTEAGCTADILAWAPKVKPGGWVCGHDHQYATVVRSLDRHLPGWEKHDHLCWRAPKSAFTV